MGNLILTIGLACLASTPIDSGHCSRDDLHRISVATHASFPAASEQGESATGLLALISPKSDMSVMFDPALYSGVLTWRFNAPEAYDRWTGYAIAANAPFETAVSAPQNDKPLDIEISSPRPVADPVRMEDAGPKPVPARKNEIERSAREADAKADPRARLSTSPVVAAIQPSSAQPLAPITVTAPNPLIDTQPRLPLATSIREGSSVLAPLAFLRFCKDYESQCNFDRSGAIVSLDADTWKLLEDVNRSVNRKIQPVNEVHDSWNIGVTNGDCDDYAVEKRLQLIARGLPVSALSLTEVVARGEGHLVLAVRTDRGVFILDNLRQNIMGWTQTGYQFVKMQSLDRPSFWVAIGGVEAPAVRVASSSRPVVKRKQQSAETPAQFNRS